MRRLATTLAVCALLVIVPREAAAHPGTGIVIDSRGNVFYTDLVHVWRITPDGRKSIAVRDVHTHELALDGAGNLYGEDSRYMGGERYRHRVWRRNAAGRIEDIVPWTDGFWRQYGFVRDRAGAQYWTECPERVCRIRRRSAAGRIETFAPRARFSAPINWIEAAPDGRLFVLDGDALRVVNAAGTLSTLVDSLGGAPMGMSPDSAGNVYVAVYHARAVKLVTKAGGVATVARTPAPWGPSGVTRARNGDLWILEYSTTNEARVRRVSPNGRVSVF